jgi:hypothetical protein
VAGITIRIRLLFISKHGEGIAGFLPLWEELKPTLVFPLLELPQKFLLEEVISLQEFVGELFPIYEFLGDCLYDHGLLRDLYRLVVLVYRDTQGFNSLLSDLI